VSGHADSTSDGAAAAAAPRRRWWRRILLPAAPDVLALLAAQGEHTVAALTAFDGWSNGGGHEAAAALHAARDAAYQARRELLQALQAALSTPVDQEDLYILSERVDRVLNEARNALREAEVLNWKPDDHAGLMGAQLAEGTRALAVGFDLLREDQEAAGRQSDAAAEAVHHVEHDYREAMAALLKEDNLRAVLAAQDLYRRYLNVAELIVAVADRLWYIVLRGA
jgi:uncharacterized protein Yka (UPF0111/DUF47 family)